MDYCHVEADHSNLDNMLNLPYHRLGCDILLTGYRIPSLPDLHFHRPVAADSMLLEGELGSIREVAEVGRPILIEEDSLVEAVQNYMEDFDHTGPVEDKMEEFPVDHIPAVVEDILDPLEGIEVDNNPLHHDFHHFLAIYDDEARARQDILDWEYMVVLALVAADENRSAGNMAALRRDPFCFVVPNKIL